MSTLKTSNIQDTSGSNNSTTEQIAQGRAKAWVNVNQTGTQTIIDSFNVASLTDIGTGQTNVTFTTAMPNANYAIVLGAASTGSFADWSALQAYLQTTVSTTGFRIFNVDENNNFYDTNSFSAVVFGG